MNYKVRNINLNSLDYETLVEWWTWFRFSPPPKDFLPNSGVMLSVDGVNVVAGFIYKTNSKISWIEFIVSNPNVKDKELRKKAIQQLINILVEYAKKMESKYIYTSLKNQSLINHFEVNGFVKGSVNCTEMIKVL